MSRVCPQSMMWAATYTASIPISTLLHSSNAITAEGIRNNVINNSTFTAHLQYRMYPQCTHKVNIFLVTGVCRGYTPLMAGKTETLKMRLTPEEKASFLAASELSGLSLSAWIRERLRRSSRIELEEAGEKVPFRKKRR